jgi:hypothetical protein
MNISPGATAWLIYGAFLAYWWVVALWAVMRFRRDPNWQPPGVSQFQEFFRIRLSTRGYVRLMVFAALLVSLSALSIPKLWASILEGHK